MRWSSMSVQRVLLAAVLAACVLAHPAMGAGPDIMHSDVTDTAHYGPVNVNGAPVHGYSWGSATCNVGDTALAWVNHGSPGLAMNAYRLFDGRLEQIGLGFCKTACCAGNGPGCGGTCASTGTGLRAGCRDLYGAGINGSQGYLGPRSSIDPYSGVFTTFSSGTGDAIWRRVQVPQTEMTEATFPGALYFAEGVYAAMDEGPEAKLNNASYRREVVANTGTSPNFFWTAAGATQAGRPAIFAWRDHGLGPNVPDPSVAVVSADVPAEGRFFVASKTVDLGDGHWRYEYAVFNLNSQLAGAKLSVPVSPDATVTGLGFRDVSYHSGEIYDSSDWQMSRTARAVEWRCPQTFEENPAANALRWATMYNFWFTANVAPSARPGAVTIGLFRPAEVGQIDADGVSVPSVACAGCPADHNCSGLVSVQDIFDYLADYFGGLAAADFNSQGGITVQDLLDFITAFMAGC